jgi:hypothetical protein
MDNDVSRKFKKSEFIQRNVEWLLLPQLRSEISVENSIQRFDILSPATVDTDDPPINPLLCIISLDGHFEITISLNKHGT